MTESHQPAASTFEPDWISPPGETIEDLLEEKGWTRAEFAEQSGLSRALVDELIEGIATIGPAIAVKLSLLLGSTPDFWLLREKRYRKKLERQAFDGLAAQAG